MNGGPEGDAARMNVTGLKNRIDKQERELQRLKSQVENLIRRVEELESQTRTQ